MLGYVFVKVLPAELAGTDGLTASQRVTEEGSAQWLPTAEPPHERGARLSKAASSPIRDPSTHLPSPAGVDVQAIVQMLQARYRQHDLHRRFVIDLGSTNLSGVHTGVFYSRTHI